MKKLFFGMLLASVMGAFFACQKDNALSTSDDLINTIAGSDNKEAIAVADLPAEITTQVGQTYAPIGIEGAWHVRKAGYEIALEDGHLLYFNENRHLLGKDDGSRHPHGRPRCLRGDSIDLADLPAAITGFVNDSFPGETIVKAVVKPSGAYAVKLSNDEVLLFDADGNFIRECGRPAGPPPGPGGPGGGHPCGCMFGDTVTVDDLPAAATGYITDNYPDETVQTVVLKASGKFAVELSDGTVLLFSADGNFIKECGVTEPGSGGYGPWGPGGNGPGGGVGPGGGHGGHGGPHGGMGGTQVTVDDLPQAALDYIAANYPGATVDHAVQKPNGFYLVKLSNGERILFDGDGNMLFDSGN